MFLLSYDLGTGGIKAALYREDLTPAAEQFLEYPTYYPAPGFHEQSPEDWWQAVCQSTRTLLEKTGTCPKDVAGIALSGASLVAVPIGRDGTPLLDRVPIWSDTRAEAEAADFFTRIPEADWYTITGNGFPPACYSIFKLMWMRKHQPEIFAKTGCTLGSKDYINFRLTGEIATDTSYASGTGAFDLKKGVMNLQLLNAADLPESLFPPLIPSHAQVGSVTAEAASATGIARGTPVFCGGVDNACMALGAVGAENGRAFVSLGSSAWIPLNCDTPVLDKKSRPYTFAHIEPEMFTSAYSLFAGGNSLRWARDVLCPDLPKETAYDEISALAAASPPGANGVLFHPGLAGGTMQDKSPHLRGAFMHLQLGTRREDLLRAVLEGVALNLELSLALLQEKAAVREPLLICGGGSRSPVWMQIFADILGVSVEKTNVDQSAASLGAAAIAARGLSLWQDYSGIRQLHTTERLYTPDPARSAFYREKQLPLFRKVCRMTASLGEAVRQQNP